LISHAISIKREIAQGGAPCSMLLRKAPACGTFTSNAAGVNGKVDIPLRDETGHAKQYQPSNI
jgi:hypothetical protein